MSEINYIVMLHLKLINQNQIIDIYQNQNQIIVLNDLNLKL